MKLRAAGLTVSLAGKVKAPAAQRESKAFLRMIDGESGGAVLFTPNDVCHPGALPGALPWICNPAKCAAQQREPLSAEPLEAIAVGAELL